MREINFKKAPNCIKIFRKKSAFYVCLFLVLLLFINGFIYSFLQQKSISNGLLEIKKNLNSIEICLNSDYYGKHRNACLTRLSLISKQLDNSKSATPDLAVDWGIAQSYFRLEDVNSNPKLAEPIFQWINLEKYIKNPIGDLIGTKENIKLIKKELKNNFLLFNLNENS